MKIEKGYFCVLLLVLIFLVIIVYVNNDCSGCEECSWNSLAGVPFGFADEVDNLTICNWGGWQTITTDVRNQVCNGTCGEGMYCPGEFSQTETKTIDANCVLDNLAEINISSWTPEGNCTCNSGCQSY